jgi:hypothetical protein
MSVVTKWLTLWAGPEGRIPLVGGLSFRAVDPVAVTLVVADHQAPETHVRSWRFSRELLVDGAGSLTEPVGAGDVLVGPDPDDPGLLIITVACGVGDAISLFVARRDVDDFLLRSCRIVPIGGELARVRADLDRSLADILGEVAS